MKDYFKDVEEVTIEENKEPIVEKDTLSNVLLGVGVPCSFSHIHFVTAMSFTLAMCGALSEGINMHLIPETNGYIDDLRNKITEIARKKGCSHLIMTDMDMTYPTDSFYKLLSKCNEDTPIVGGLCFKRYPDFTPLTLRGTPSKYKILVPDRYENGELIKGDWSYGDFIEVDATGTGCLMVHMSVFDKMKKPWFKFVKTTDYGIKVPGFSQGINVGEDIGFCYKARKLGLKIFIDTSVELGHNTTLTVDHKTFELFSELKKHNLKVDNSKRKDEYKDYKQDYFENASLKETNIENLFSNPLYLKMLEHFKLEDGSVDWDKLELSLRRKLNKNERKKILAVYEEYKK